MLKMEPLLILPLLVAFFITFLILPSWIRQGKKFGLTGKDMNKFREVKVVEAGGITAITGFILSVLLYIALKTFYFDSNENIIEIFAILSSVLILAFVGLIDGLLGWKIGLRKRFRILLCLFAAVPLMVINAGHSTISIPLLGQIQLNWIYPLFLIPIGIVGTSTTFNFLAGFNGLESGQGILLLGACSLVAALTGSQWLALIGLCMIFALLAFWIFNRYPAKVFPGDVLTYPVGGMIAIMAILGNFEKIAVFFFIPYLLEVVLKLRGKLNKQSFGKPNKDGSLDLQYNKFYGLEHISIWILKKFNRANEKNVVYLIHAFQIIIIILGFIIFREHIFI